jgi:hypothetical protein
MKATIDGGVVTGGPIGGTREHNDTLRGEWTEGYGIKQS